MENREQLELRGELAREERGRGKRYAIEVKRRAIEYAKRRRAQGRSLAEIGVELGLSVETVRRWCLASSAKPRGKALVAVELMEPPRSLLSVVSPSGYRVEGLTLEEAVTVLRALR